MTATRTAEIVEVGISDQGASRKNPLIRFGLNSITELAGLFARVGWVVMVSLVFLALSMAPRVGSASPPASAESRTATTTNLETSKRLSSDTQAPLRRFRVQSSWSERVRSLFGLFVMVGIAWLLSTDRRKIRWSVVAVGISIQVGLGLLTRTTAGAWVFSGFNQLVTSLLAYTAEGSTFIFGDLAKPEHSAFIAFGVLPTIIFFSALMAFLYHSGVMPRVVRALAWSVQRALGTSGAETLSAVGNIFVGQTEAPLLIRPFLKDMTRSELMAVMTGGFATVAGGVMIVYIGVLSKVFSEVAGHLLSASIMSAPAALVVAKIMVPETETPKTLGSVDTNLKSDSVNVVDAVARGVSEGLTLTLNVAAMLLAFTALVAMGNGFLGGLCSLLGLPVLTFETILGWLLAPLAWVMGICWEDSAQIGSLLGIKTILNELFAYLRLAELAPELAPRTVVIASYALCGFANLASIGIQLGGITPLAPSRRKDLAQLAFRAMLGGTLAGFMTACVIGFIL